MEPFAVRHLRRLLFQSFIGLEQAQQVKTYRHGMVKT